MMISRMLSREAISNLQAKFMGDISIIGEGFQEALLIEATSFLSSMSVLKNDAAYQFNMLSNLTATDYLEYFEIIYHLYSLPLGHRVTIKIRCNMEEAVIPSVMAIWPSADFQEREIYDLLGVSFTGHMDLRRILLPEDFMGHPLRKGYKLPIRGERRS